LNLAFALHQQNKSRHEELYRRKPLIQQEQQLRDEPQEGQPARKVSLRGGKEIYA
jgi:hypothetical protein